MDAGLDTLATALYVTCDDLLKAHPERVAPRPAGAFLHPHRRRRNGDVGTTSLPGRHITVPCSLPARTPSSPTKTTSDANSNENSHTPTSLCCGPRGKVKYAVWQNDSSNHYVKSSNRSTTPSTDNSTSKHTADAPPPVCARITQRILALTATIWHNDHPGATIRRSLTAYDH